MDPSTPRSPVLRAVATLLVQALVSVLIVGFLLPSVLAGLPSVRASSAGRWLAFGSAAVLFLLIRLVWPRSKQK
jgi:hypothetical protein